MRCLQCGKTVPLLKRMAGTEFCSEAHRREYQHEYSQLALGRLLQSQRTETQAPLVKGPPLGNAPRPAIDEPSATAANGLPAMNGTSTMAGPTPAPAVLAANPVESAKAEPPGTTTKDSSRPDPAQQPAFIQKPPPAEWRFAPAAAPEFEYASASLAPGRPRRQSNLLLAKLPQGRAVALEGGVEIADSITRPIEGKLELREATRTTPRIALDLRIVPPESLEPERQPLAIPIALAEPAEASLWSGPHHDFAGELASLSDFADAQFGKSDFEEPAPDGSPVSSAVREPLPSEPQQTAAESEAIPEKKKNSLVESQTSASGPHVTVPDPELNPLPVNSPGIAPGKAKAIPVMVLSTASGPSTEVNYRKAAVSSLGSDLSFPPAAPSAEISLGLPELRTETPAGAMASRMRKILAALTGAAVLGAGIFFFMGKRSDAGSKPPTPVALADGGLSGQWIANFAPDAQRQRRVSILRSSMNLSAYRLDFESSIQIKALGWVYRAQDSKNFYVSKIEFQKPGQNPVYALVHYAVINGVSQPRVATPLHVSVAMGGLYKIRFEAVGNRFTTWVQDQRVEQWTDARLSSGGAGLYGEGMEQSILHGEFVVTPL
jgi:hypothetical protein